MKHLSQLILITLPLIGVENSTKKIFTTPPCGGLSGPRGGRLVLGAMKSKCCGEAEISATRII
jgi:hypothetical protein